jgi:hypothetical protein
MQDKTRKKTKQKTTDSTKQDKRDDTQYWIRLGIGGYDKVLGLGFELGLGLVETKLEMRLGARLHTKQRQDKKKQEKTRRDKKRQDRKQEA